MLKNEKNNPFEDSIFHTQGDQSRLNEYVLYPDHLERLSSAITSTKLAVGRNAKTIMVSSPEAGHGKSHLIAKALKETALNNVILELPLNKIEHFNFDEILRLAIESLYGKTSINYPVRNLFASLICDLIKKGIVPVADISSATNALSQHNIRMLDFKDEKSLIAKWFKGNINAVFPHLINSMSDLTGVSKESCDFWIKTLYECELDNSKNALKNIKALPDREAQDRLEDFEKIFSKDHSLILVFDHMDSLFGDQQKGLKIAQLISKIDSSNLSVVTIFAINDDLWHSCFKESIPSALRDRINESNLRLNGINLQSARNLIRERMKLAGQDSETAEAIIQGINLESTFYSEPNESKPSIRGILRTASSQWQQMENQREQLHESKNASKASLINDDSPTISSISEMMKSVNKRSRASIEPDQPVKASKNLEPPFKYIENSAPDSVKDFVQHRDELYSSGQSLFDIEALKYTLEIAAKRSPVIKHREIKIDQKSSATSWLSYDTEFIFGFETPDKISYWNKVIKTSEESSANTSKIIAFSFPDSEKFNQSIKEKVNIIDLSRAELASLAAGNTVIQESDDEGKVFSEIAPELESIWKRITRSA